METTEINNLRRIVADLRAASLHTVNTRLSVCVDLCALAIEREMKWVNDNDKTREVEDRSVENRSVNVLDGDTDPVSLMRRFPVFVEGKAVRP